MKLITKILPPGLSFLSFTTPYINSEISLLTKFLLFESFSIDLSYLNNFFLLFQLFLLDH